MKLFRILDPFTLTLITVVLLASFFPARGDFVPFFENLTTAAIALLFFMHGAKLSREAIIAGGGHWRLHLWVMCSTFVLFPILGVLFAWWKPVNVDPMLYSGFLYLCILPATVQSAIAFTSMAGGNVAAAVCSASASSLLGIFLSPLLVGLVMNVHGARMLPAPVTGYCWQPCSGWRREHFMHWAAAPIKLRAVHTPGEYLWILFNCRQRGKLRWWMSSGVCRADVKNRLSMGYSSDTHILRQP